jgi:hypothetical protein
MFEAAELKGCLHTLAEEMQPSIISRTFPRKIVPPPHFPKTKDFVTDFACCRRAC